MLAHRGGQRGAQPPSAGASGGVQTMRPCARALRLPMLPCSHAPMLPCSHAPMLPCSHAPMLPMLPCSPCSHAPMPLPCSHAPMLPCSHAPMPPCSPDAPFVGNCHHSFAARPTPLLTFVHGATFLSRPDPRTPHLRRPGVSSYLENPRRSPPARRSPPRSDAHPKAQTAIVIDFGSQFSMLIARRVRECHVYCELVPHDAPGRPLPS